MKYKMKGGFWSCFTVYQCLSGKIGRKLPIGRHTHIFPHSHSWANFYSGRSLFFKTLLLYGLRHLPDSGL